jgi:two-component system NtrC family response regulator
MMDALLKPKILIVDDEEDIRNQMRWALSQDYEVFLAEDRAGALQNLERERPSVVTLDLGLPPHPRDVEEGFKTLEDLLAEDPLVKVVIISGRGEKENALKAIGLGAYDFFPKPILIDELKVIIRRAFQMYSLEQENLELQRRLNNGPFEEILGTSTQMTQVFTSIRKVATTDASVLVAGESGTGKELVSKAIHRQSFRSNGPFVAINCGAIPENLLESELFGHEKGAFTGAHVQRRGRIELAEKGTLFLDEIGELPLPLQVKLLRFLQEHTIESVGGREEIGVDTRVISATNTDLKKAIQEGRFREDLYHRLGVVTIQVPPLRERGEDILLLARTFLQKYSTGNKKKISGFTRPAIIAINSYRWPGNVRELENKIKRAVIMAEGTKVTPEDMELTSATSKFEGFGLREARDAFEKEFIQESLTKNRGNISQTAIELGISRPTLHELIDKLGIEKDRGHKDRA